MQGDAAPFDLPGDDRGVLCLHGFTGTPFEMRYLGERLHGRGFTVVGPALPGHGTRVADLERTGWRDWFGAAEAAAEALARRCRQVAVVGQSLGGLLALHLAARRPELTAAIASLAAPLWLPPLSRAAAELYARVPLAAELVPVIPKPGGASDVRDPAMRRRNPSYRAVPMRAFLEFCAFMRMVRGELRQVRAPALIVHARQDHTAPFACSRALARGLGSRVVRRREMFGSYHLVSLDIERDLVALEVGRFFAEQLAAPAVARAERSRSA